jgi:hypothetical protein
MKALVPCHSSTPKSASKPSVIVYHGMWQSIRGFTRAMSGCGAREANAALRSFEPVILLDGEPWHTPTLGDEGVTGPGHLLLLNQQPLAGGFPLLCRNDRGCVHGGLLPPLLPAALHPDPLPALRVPNFAPTFSHDGSAYSPGLPM